MYKTMASSDQLEINLHNIVSQCDKTSDSIHILGFAKSAVGLYKFFQFTGFTDCNLQLNFEKKNNNKKPRE